MKPIFLDKATVELVGTKGWKRVGKEIIFLDSYS